MREIENLILEWRKKLSGRVAPERIEEIEGHLREVIEERMRKGLSAREAFDVAVKRLGPAETISAEFEKLEPPMWWPARIAIAFWAMVALLLPVLLIVRFEQRSAAFEWENYILGVHVYTITLGYGATFLLGGLGICYVCQRLFGELSMGRLRSLARVCFAFSAVAAVLTGIGVVLGMVWAHGAWGRYWGWDPKENGGLVTFLGLAAIAICSGRKMVSTHALMLMSVLGNIVVAMAWFAPNLMMGTTGYRAATYSMLGVATVGSLVFFLVGLAPAGWLKAREAQ